MPQQKLGRSWGTRFDSLTSSGSISSNADSVLESSRRAVSPPRNISVDEGHCTQDAHDKIVQDASIFIGSLPSNIDHAELMNMLNQHLSEHPEVQSVKVVRDSKGGTCAFIQCQDAEAASTLMNNLHSSPPQPFLGRYLRYEPARAFRTLLISYRSPRQYIRQRDASKKGSMAFEDQKFIELELPNAMRIVRTPGTKQPTILYNSDALDNPAAGGADSGLLLVPLLYDTESLMRITSVFGSVEYFGPYAYGDEDGRPSVNPPAPHDAARSPVMDPGCWRVKWANRDDCVSALVTLRRIPHLTVTWAHQSSMTPREQKPYNNSRALSAAQAAHSWRGRSAGSGLRSSTAFLPPSHTSPNFPGDTEGSTVVQLPPDSHVADPSLSPSPGGNVWPQEPVAMPSNRAVFLSRSTRPRALSLTHDRPQPTVSLPSRESTGQLSFTTWESSSRTRWANHAESLEFKGSSSVAGPGFNASPFLGQDKTVSSESTCHIFQEDQEIETDVSPTPELGTSPITPRTPGSLVLRTPTTASYMGDFQNASFREFESQSSLAHLSQEKRDDTVVDPTTIFVGGLEMFGPNAWDETKVRALFSKYGGIETVRVIRPSNKRSAFAFVKFNNTDAPARAVKAEHNRILDGRLIRVQLRDWNPAYRPPWRPGQKREWDSHSIGATDEFSVDPGLSGPGIINLATQVSNLRLSDTPTQHAPVLVDESCPLNEVEDDAKIPRTEVPSQTVPDDPELCCSDILKMENSIEVKQSEPVSLDVTPAPPQNPIGPGPAVPTTYPAPSVQYYHGWIPSFGPHLPYQMPFPGHPFQGYAFPPPVVGPVPQGGGSDGSGAPSNTNPPVPFGPPAGPYSVFTPYPPPNQASDSGAAVPGPLGAANNPSVLHAQAPLIPTGFIQGDQGMLVPVYPPDALNQYMAGNQEAGQLPGHASGSTDGQLPAAWRAYPPPLAPIRPQAVIFHPYINPSMPPGPHTWMPGHAWHGGPPQLGNPQAIPTRRFSSSPSGGPSTHSMGTTFERHGNLPPRRQYRRDNHAQYHKNNFTRSANTRFGKAPFESSRSPSDTQPVYTPQTVAPDAPVEGGWQHWSVDQGNLP